MKNNLFLFLALLRMIRVIDGNINFGNGTRSVLLQNSFYTQTRVNWI